MSQQEEVTEFYDKFVDKQAKVGITPRHRIIIKNLKKIGLTPLLMSWRSDVELERLVH